ncbi:MAG TPA: Clp protease N-terminal domain-containing protein [Fimbriimonadaceae bacterium]|jgi:ATP-dependent Clp protease ATP-binding subunit ClpA
MWQRFSQEARHAVFSAQEEAQANGEGFVDPNHLFLGAIREKQAMACQALELMAISCDDLARKLRRFFPQGDRRPSRDMTLTPRAKRVIDLAYSEARDLNDNHIGTEHLMLGVLAEGSTQASKLLNEIGATIPVIRDAVLRLREQGKSEDTSRSMDATAAAAEIEKRRRENRLRIPGKYASLLLVARQNLSVPRLILLTALADHDGSAAVAFARAAGLNHKMLHFLLEQRMLNSQDPPSEVRIDTVLARASEISVTRGEVLNSAHLFFAIFDLRADPYLQELIGDISLENLMTLLDEES